MSKKKDINNREIPLFEYDFEPFDPELLTIRDPETGINTSEELFQELEEDFDYYDQQESEHIAGLEDLGALAEETESRLPSKDFLDGRERRVDDSRKDDSSIP